MEFDKPSSEADLLVQAKWFLSLLERLGLLTYTRIHVGGIIRHGRLMPNREMIGFADLEIIAKGKVLYVELKSKKGALREEQIQFRDRTIRHGAHYLLCRDLSELVAALEEIGVPANNVLKMKGN